MEKIVVRVEVDGVELAPVQMPEGKQDLFYEDGMTFFKMGHVLDVKGKEVSYRYSIRLDRRKTEEELKEG